MNEREELEALRRMAELEAKASSQGMGADFQAAQQAARNAQMTHPYQQASAKDLYSQQAGKQSFLQNLGAGAGGAMYGLGYLGPKSLIGADEPGEVADWKASMSGLNTTGGGTIGSLLGSASLAPLAMLPGANTLPGALVTGMATGALQPAESGRERAANVAAGGVGGYGGQYAGQKIGQLAANRLSRATAAKTGEAMRNSVRDETMRIGRAEGMVLPPSATGNRSMLETMGGQIKTQQEAAWKNQQVLNKLARRALGMPENTPITADTIKAVRDTAGQEYAKIKNLGRLKIDSDMPGAQVEVTRQNWFGDVGDNLPKQQYKYLNADEALENMKQLRHDGHQLLSAARETGDPAQRAEALSLLSGANAIEDAFETNLQARGMTQQLENFRKARQRIAQAYDVEDSMRSGAGDVQGRILARAYDEGEKRAGPRLTGDLATAGRFSNTFPQQTQWRSFETPRNSPLDLATGTIAASASNSPAGWLAGGIPYLRGPARDSLLKESRQNALMRPTYNVPASTRLLGNALPSETMNALERMIVPSVLLQSLQFGQQ